MDKIYDVLIVGGGPAGLSAGLYASRAKLETLIIEKELIGGQIVTTTLIENYPGASKDTTGPVLVERMKEQCIEFGVKFEFDDIVNIEKKGKYFHVKSASKEYLSKTCIIATGAKPKMLGVPGELKFRGLGVSYCATCDAGFFKDLNVSVVGGGDSALKEAIYLTKFAKEVTIIHRRDEFRGSQHLQKQIKEHPSIKLLLSSEVVEIVGEHFVTGIIIKDKKENKEYEYKTDGVFMFVGYEPNSKGFENVVLLDKSGYMTTNEELQSITAGLYVAGDVRKKTLRQVITAASDGAICAIAAEQFIENVF